jgi:hypothetical protein
MGVIYGSMGYTVSGRKKKSYRKKNSFNKSGFVPLDTRDHYRRETREYPSRPDTNGVAAKLVPPQYTGTLVKGIGTMHKSNAVPIIDEEQMKDLARMRR